MLQASLRLPLLSRQSQSSATSRRLFTKRKVFVLVAPDSGLCLTLVHKNYTVCLPLSRDDKKVSFAVAISYYERPALRLSGGLSTLPRLPLNGQPPFDIISCHHSRRRLRIKLYGPQGHYFMVLTCAWLISRSAPASSGEGLHIYPILQATAEACWFD